ncbi:TetR family transcriptional regulator [Moraxella caviae]|uniref:Division inhibitor protein n=1 Tax=Moraxella caviae TaxID=34060 RepID=A0A1S9ZXG5_9GAMM|nr:TetR/AcrR family transcriptional regulator [Moraxella caviae]OOR88099.1 TetR family transcriptional regulator [Moraxella caviae]STZ09955.1 division inhibitor protein [Moraxella caviae]VEW11646.1 division inhibitor protein [Moraxella caviae]
MTNKKQQFALREKKILQTAEQLLLESGEGDLTLDALAQHLDLAKGTLYKHFVSKDELLLRILIEYEQRLFAMNAVDDGVSAGVARMVLQQLRLPQRAMLFNHMEERLAGTASGLNKLFGELYRVRRERMKRLAYLAERYLAEQNSSMTTRDYLSHIWAVGQGGAGLLNSSFYQRYLGSRNTLKYALVLHMLHLPKLYPQDGNAQAQALENQAFDEELARIPELADLPESG